MPAEPTSSSPCPKCGNQIPIPDSCVGMWDGKKPDGTKIGGGIFKTKCNNCETELIALWDVLEDAITWKVDSKLKQPPLQTSN
jgi:hypothetical protein